MSTSSSSEMPPTGQVSLQDAIHVRKLLEILVLHRKLFIQIVGFCVLLGLVYCFVAPRMYQGTASIEMRTISPRALNQEGAAIHEDTRVGVI